ncbi:MAG: hypothetical protein CML46_17080 [Rhodobacteraceae bacterium]|nr:hypothetical protein [Paracoccaceae bacterium]MBR28631.1 hypothetical protein [Paracoccaceae bacterium]
MRPGTMSRPTPLPARPLRPVATPALRGTICGVLAALWFGPLPGLAQDAPTAPPARDQRMVFHLDWGPAPLARIEMRIREDGPPDARRRVAEARGEPVGLAGLLSDFRLTQRGEILPDGARRFDATSNMDGEDVTRSVRWAGPDAAPEVLDSGPPPERPMTPIPAGELDDVVSPSGAALALLDQVAAGEGCDAEFRMFDGVRRLNMTVIDEGPDRLERDRDWTYAGPAHRCRIRFERIGGFPAEAADDAPGPLSGRGGLRDGGGRDGASGGVASSIWPRRVAEEDYDRLLWLAPLPAGLSPVRLRVEWPLGYVTARIDLEE